MDFNHNIISYVFYKVFRYISVKFNQEYFHKLFSFSETSDFVLVLAYVAKSRERISFCERVYFKVLFGKYIRSCYYYYSVLFQVGERTVKFHWQKIPIPPRQILLCWKVEKDFWYCSRTGMYFVEPRNEHWLTIYLRVFNSFLSL